MKKTKLVLSQPLMLMASDASQQMELKANVPYLMNQDTYKSLSQLFPDKIIEGSDYEFKNKTTLEEAKSILVWRSGGIGDLLFTFPYIYALKHRNQFLKIDFITMEKNFPIVNLNQCISKVYAEPLEYTPEIDSYDYYIILDNFIENNPAAEVLNAYDVGAEFFRLKRVEPPFPSVLNVVLPEIRKEKKIHIAISVSASVPIRNVSHLRWWDLLKGLDPNIFRVSLIGMNFNQDQIADIIKGTRNFNPKLEIVPVVGKSMKHIIDMFLRADKPHITIGLDSGIINLFGYHGLPVIGLFGPFPSDLRLRYYEYAIGIDSISGCVFAKNDHSDCFLHGNGSCKLAIAKKEINAPCIAKIETEYIVQGIFTILRDVYNWGN